MHSTFLENIEAPINNLTKLIVDSMDEVWDAYKKSGLDDKMIEFMKNNHKESDITRTSDGKIIYWL